MFGQQFNFDEILVCMVSGYVRHVHYFFSDTLNYGSGYVKNDQACIFVFIMDLLVLYGDL